MASKSIDERKWENCLQMDTDTQQDFDQIKNKICTEPLPVLPDLYQPFEINTYASDYAPGAMITQLGHPVAFHSETFRNTVKRYSTYEK